jgi:hypothetical protein
MRRTAEGMAAHFDVSERLLSKLSNDQVLGRVAPLSYKFLSNLICGVDF